jgi:hypothetical protein
VEHLDHTVEFLGFKLFASEVFLTREERTLNTWRQYLLPFPLIAVLWILAPFGAAAIVAASIVYASPRNETPTDTPLWRELDVRATAGGVVLAASLVFWIVAIHEESDAVLVSRAAQSFHGAASIENHPDGLWTGDIAELYRFGGVRRAIAEADAAPIRPLVPHPRPYHGYLFFAMDTGPDGIPLKRTPRNREYAYCAFPVNEGPDQNVWLVCSTGFFGRRMEGGKPIRDWPTDKELQQGWGRYCGIPEPFLPLAYGAKIPSLALK